MSSPKGFVISFDAILALFVIFAFLIASFSLISKIEDTSYNDLFIKSYSNDALMVLDNSGKLQSAVLAEDSEGIDEFLNFLPLSYCARIDIFEQGSENVLLSSSRSSCRNVPENSFLARRFFIVNDSGTNFYYIAELRAWLSG